MLAVFSKNIEGESTRCTDLSLCHPLLTQQMTTTRPKSTSPVPSSGDGKNGTPSGFVLKLYQMVNGAPDDIVSVSASNCSLICLIREESGFAPFEGGVTNTTLLRINVTIWACRNAMVYPLSPWMLIRLSEHMMCMSLYVHILMFLGIMNTGAGCHCQGYKSFLFTYQRASQSISSIQ